MTPRCCFKEQRYKLNASNSQLGRQISSVRSRCFKEQRYKLNASNSQRLNYSLEDGICCFKEQRYKLNASNSQPNVLHILFLQSCFKEQRYKLNASNSQQTQPDSGCRYVVSMSKDISLFAQSSKIFHVGFQPALTHRKLSRISLFSRKVS